VVPLLICWLWVVLVVAVVGFEAAVVGFEAAVVGFEAAAAGSKTQIRSPETTPQDARVCSESDSSSEPPRDKPNSVSALRGERRT